LYKPESIKRFGQPGKWDLDLHQVRMVRFHKSIGAENCSADDSGGTCV